MLYLWACCKRDQRNWRGREGSMKFTTRLKNFSEKHWTTLWCILYLSTPWQEPVTCYWQRKSLQSKDKELTERENLFTGLFLYNLYKHILIFHFLSLRSVKPKAAGERYSSSSALQSLNFCCVHPVSWPLLLTASCPASYASRNRKS